MQSLKFKQVLILSNSSNSANQFKFSENLNLITAIDNSVGKSTLVKLLFWGLGCEPTLDTTWSSLDCKTIVDFQIGNNHYSVKRYKNQISLRENNNSFVDYSKITDDYSKKIASIFRFKALLPNRSSGLLETPPPAYYFLPFYIDQKRSWASAWNNFDNLGQFENWKSTIIKYHVGLLTPAHFELESQKVEKKDCQKDIQVQIDKINTALEVVENFIPQLSQATVDNVKFEKLTTEIMIDLRALQENQENFLNELSQLNGERVYLEHQQNITERIILELDNDYKFTIENINGDEIECPLCGVVHDNSIINRASIMSDKTQAENQLKTICRELEKVNNKLSKIQIALDQARNQIETINDKYVIYDEGQKIEFVEIIESIAGNSIKQNVINEKTNKLVKIDSLNGEIKAISKEQKDLLTKDEIVTINDSFNNTFSRYIEFLDAEAVNISEIRSPLDYNKVIKEGGAAEGSRAILAYYMTIFTLVEGFGNEVKSCLVIDTPNQQEQSHSNYARIVDILTNKISSNTQVILCAMENEHLNSYKEKASIITLDKNMLLDKAKYEEIKKIFETE